MAKRILVPLDRETAHEASLPVGADLARGAGATVRLLHVAVVPDNVVDDDGHVVAYVDQEMHRLETEWRDSLVPGEEACCCWSSSMPSGSEPVEQILADAGEFDADLTVVTTTRRSAVRCALLGSVADRLIRLAKCSVLLLRPAPASAEQRPGPATGIRPFTSAGSQ